MDRPRIGALLALALLVPGCPRGPARLPDAPDLASMPPLIPRQLLFAGAGRAQPLISPDGKRLAYLSPVRGVVNVWVQTLGKSDAAPVTRDEHRGISRFFWAESSSSLLYFQDTGGDENFRLHRVELASGRVTVLTPRRGVRARVVGVSKRHPGQLLIALNQRNPSLFDVYRLDLDRGSLTLDTENPGGVVGWHADFEYRIRAARAMDPKGGSRLLVRDRPGDPWRVVRSWGPRSQGRPIGFSRDGKSIFLLDNKGRDKAALVQLALDTGRVTELAADPRADLTRQTLVHPDRRTVQAIATDYLRPRWKVLDPLVKPDFTRLRQLAGGLSFRVLNRTSDDRLWVVEVSGDIRRSRYYLYSRKTRLAEFLFAVRPELDRYQLARMTTQVIRARDGLRLVCYLTLPPGRRARRLPLVLLVHGGPWSRDHWRYHPWVQWLANRGYAVLQVNYRGSAGFGKAFLNAGNREWGRRMQHDLTDAVDWAVRRGIADPRRVAIMGGSYGGYAALAGVTFTPKRYAAAVDLVGPSNLETLLRAIPPYWKPLQAIFRVRVGDLRRDAQLLRSRSPLFSAHRIRAPLLIFQGRNDPRVKLRESDQIVAAIRQRGGRVGYIVYPDEGHGIRRPENRLDFAGRTEAFLRRHLGGRAEPFRGGSGSSAQVR